MRTGSHWYPQILWEGLAGTSRSHRLRASLLSNLYAKPLERVQVLGDDETEGHTGCVNALHWAQDGEVLISGSDDRTVRLWTMDASRADDLQPFGCSAVINTGHRANIFNARMLPHSSRIATAAGDKQVRVFDIANLTPVDREYSNARTHLLLCHEDRVKRIVTEDSPDVFLTVSEDGTVRQHDLRSSHSCRTECPAPLVQMDHELTSLSLSPLTPYQFVVAGDAAYGYLFDRRSLRVRTSLETSKELTTCTRLFARENTGSNGSSSRFRRDHVTGVRMCASSGDELLMAYSGDYVYRFSTLDEPSDPQEAEKATISNNEEHNDAEDMRELETEQEPSPSSESGFSNKRRDLPVILPAQQYRGARNVETVKDVNFLGPNDEYVTVGSDDGNFFIWKKDDATLHGIYEGDGSVVNVIEGHPHLPLIAVSGIDTTVKLFAPNNTGEPSKFSRSENAKNIMETNTQSRRMAPTFRRLDMVRLLMLSQQAAQGGEGEVDEDEEGAHVVACPNQ